MRWWFDPKTRGPLALCLVIASLILLGPLAWDVAVAVYYSLPLWFRHGTGQGLLLAIVAVGLVRLWRILPTDSWPAPFDGEDSRRGAIEREWGSFALLLVTLALVFPLMSNPGGLGFADWDFFLEKHEAVRRSIMDWGQFPWWDPWCRGGFPLAAEPQVGAISPATPFVLLFGTSIGLRVATLLFVWLAVEGAYRTGWLWFREAWSAAAVALIYGLNGAVLVDTAWGYFVPMSYCVVPWLLYSTFRLGDGLIHGLRLGFWTSLGVLNGVQYMTFYGGVLSGLIWLRSWRTRSASNRRVMLLSTVAAAGLFLLLTGWRLIPMLLVMRDDQRVIQTYWDESPAAAVHHLLSRPRADWPTAIPIQHLATYIETTSYVGLLALLLAAASLRHGWRWWHTLVLVSGWLALGSLQWYHPSYWLSWWPVFSSTHVVTRWRFITLLGLGLCAGSQIARWRLSAVPIARLGAMAAVLLLAGDYVSLAFQQLPIAFSVKPEPRFFPGPPVPGIENIRSGMGFPSILRGYGVIEGYEPMLGYRRDAPSVRRAREDPAYRGESWTDKGQIVPVFWSPNLLVFLVGPYEEVHINQNPGSWWLVNGEPRNERERCAEMAVPFVARAGPEGRLELRIRPRGLGLGVLSQAVGLILLIVASLTSRTRS